jgi:hypothetical protein
VKAADQDFLSEGDEDSGAENRPNYILTGEEIDQCDGNEHGHQDDGMQNGFGGTATEPKIFRLH